jgi:hypothetical protein
LPPFSGYKTLLPEDEDNRYPVILLFINQITRRHISENSYLYIHHSSEKTLNLIYLLVQFVIYARNLMQRLRWADTNKNQILISSSLSGSYEDHGLLCCDAAYFRKALRFGGTYRLYQACRLFIVGFLTFPVPLKRWSFPSYAA